MEVFPSTAIATVHPDNHIVLIPYCTCFVGVDEQIGREMWEH